MKNTILEILVIEDNEKDYLNIKAQLNEFSENTYSITWVRTYTDAIKKLVNKKYDLCLLTYKKSFENDFSLLSSAIKKINSCPFIILTELEEHQLTININDINASEYLTKNLITPKLLQLSIRYAINNKKNLDDLNKIKEQVLQQEQILSFGIQTTNLSHEFGTPLAIIKGRSELIKMKYEDPAIKRDMEIILLQIERITKIVNSLMNLAKQTQSSVGLHIEANSEFNTQSSTQSESKNNLSYNLI